MDICRSGHSELIPASVIEFTVHLREDGRKSMITQRTSVKLADKEARVEIEGVIKWKYLYQPVPIIVDTGCMNTLIDLEIADNYGEKYPEKWACNIGGQQILTQAYRLGELRINTVTVNNVLVFAADFSNTEWKRGILLGLNVLNNWCYTISKNKSEMIISEDIYDKIPDKQYAYMHWFKNEKYVNIQHPQRSSRG